MRVRIITLYLLLAFFCSQVSATIDQPDYIAPNSKVDFNFSSGTSFTTEGVFEVHDDIEVYRVVVPTDSYLDIETLGDCDPYLRLYSQDEKLLSFDSNNGEKNNSHLVYQVKAGTYFIMLDNRSDIDSYYTLNIKNYRLGDLLDDVSNALSPNSNVVLDTSLAPSVAINQTINYKGDADYFSFELKQEGNIQFSLNANSFPLRFSLYDTDYHVIEEITVDAATVLKYDLAAKKYIIVVQGEEQFSVNYTVTVSHEGAVVDADTDSLSNFNGREINHLRKLTKNTNRKSIKSSIDYIGDIDVIKITADQAGELIVIARQSPKRDKIQLPIQARLYDYKGRQLDADLGVMNFRMERNVAAGTYYLAVFSNSHVLGKYKITSILIYERD